MTRAGGPGRIQIVIVGACPDLAPIVDALAENDEVEILDSPATVGDATSTLSAWDVDAVLFATPEAALPHDELTALRAQSPAPVIVLGTAPPLLEEALDADVDALLLPQPPENVVFALRRAVSRRAADRPAAHSRVVTVFSPKGGTGKTATAVNLAVALAKCENRRTLLVDLDLQFGDCATALGLDPQRTIYDLVTAPGELDTDKLAGYITRHPAGLDVLAAPDRPEEAELVPAERLSALIDVAREEYELVVVDTSPFLHPPVLATLDRTDELLLVTTLDVPALKGVRQSLDTLELLSFDASRISLVLNRANSKAGLTAAEVEAALGLRIRFLLPSDDAVPLGVNRGNPVVLSDPRSEFAAAIREVAALAAGSSPPSPAGRGFRLALRRS